LADSAYANQVKLVQDYTKQRIDFDKLLKMTDEEEIRRTLKKFFGIINLVRMKL